MWIKSARVSGFGRLCDVEFAFCEGLNCIHGPNEAGKTTLLSFFLSMLYGQAKPGLLVRRLDELNEKYLPWRAPGYGGDLIFVLSGKEIFLHRDFSGNADRTEIIDTATGELLLSQYERNRRREYEFLRAETGIDKSTFRGVFVVHHDSIANLDASTDGAVADRLAAIADSGTETHGAQSAVDRLTSLRASIGSDRAPTQPYALTARALEEARSLLETVRTARAAYAEALSRRGELEEKASALKAELAATKSFLFHSIDAALSSMEKERESLDSEQSKLAASETVPESITLEALGRAETTVESAVKDFEKAAVADKAAKTELEKAEAALSAEKRFEGLTETAVSDAETVLVGFVQLRGECRENERRLEGLQGSIADIRTRWGERFEALEKVSAEDGGFLATFGDGKSKLLEELSERREHVSELERFKSRARAAQIRALGALTAAIASVVILEVEWWIEVTAGVAGAVLFLYMMRRASQLSRKSGNLARLKEALREIERRLEEMDSRAKALLEPFGGAGREEVVEALGGFGRDRGEMARLQIEAQTIRGIIAEKEPLCAESAGRAHSALRTLCIENAGNLRACVSALLGGEAPAQNIAEPAGGDLADDIAMPGDLRGVFAPLVEKARKMAELARFLSAAKKTRDESAGELETAAKAQAEAEERVLKLVRDAGAADAKSLRELLAGRERLREIRARLKEIENRRELFLSGRSEEAFREELATTQPPGEGARFLDEGAILRTRGLVEAKEDELNGIELDRARVTAQVEEGLRNCPEAAEVEERVSLLGERHEDQRLHRDALDEAVNMLTAAAGSFHEQVYPKVASRMEELISKATLGAHAKVSVVAGQGGAVGLSVRVTDSLKGTVVAPEALSQGAMEQVYLCARLALADAISGDEKTPVFLDDPFINYDPDRLEAAMGLIAGEAGTRQVFLFTCQRDVRDLAAGLGGRITEL